MMDMLRDVYSDVLSVSRSQFFVNELVLNEEYDVVQLSLHGILVFPLATPAVLQRQSDPFDPLPELRATFLNKD